MIFLKWKTNDVRWKRKQIMTIQGLRNVFPFVYECRKLGGYVNC